MGFAIELAGKDTTASGCVSKARGRLAMLEMVETMRGWSPMLAMASGARTVVGERRRCDCDGTGGGLE
ncbi:hypothetical protein L484_004527 [Morus notabilis]|uniref:Uncharacterized protein n=1 Tax=Morus notabilis TaxID=981085 RepID=W9QS15_9ROSA|nr:hypothetical protein L484_004527 [Morus notabilis]